MEGAVAYRRMASSISKLCAHGKRAFKKEARFEELRILYKVATGAYWKTCNRARIVSAMAPQGGDTSKRSRD